MAKEYSVYIHRHKINRKVYVGITNNIERRFRCEGGEYKNNGGVFGKAVKKYGWDAFDHYILETGLTLKQAQYLEKLYIICLDAKVPNGYNLTDGGEGTCGYVIPKESRQRIADKISEIRTGIKFSEEHKRKLSMARKTTIQKKREVGEELSPFNNKPVLQFTMSGEFVDYYDSIKDAYENTGCINIGAICSGKRKSSNGYTWRWA